MFDGDEGQLAKRIFLQDVAQDLPEAQARVLFAVQQPFHRVLVAGRTTRAAWHAKPAFYAVSTRDRTIDTGLQRFMVRRMDATTIEVPAGHLSMISHPDEIAGLVAKAAGV